jgi:hypothetical protein
MLSILKKTLMFVFLALPGLFIFLFSSTFFFVYLLGIDRNPNRIPSPMITIPLTGGAMILMLIGVGKWREWRYLAVFVAIPISWILTAICGNIIILLLIPLVISFSRHIQKHYDVLKKSENEISTANAQ